MTLPRDLDGLQSTLQVRFYDVGLLERALCDGSFRNEALGAVEDDNRRLAFLGDAVIELAVRDHLMRLHALATLETLSGGKVRLVRDQGLADAARRIPLGPHVALGKGSHEQGGRDNATVLARALEAVIGALHRDQGYGVAAACARRVLGLDGAEARAEGTLGQKK